MSFAMLQNALLLPLELAINGLLALDAYAADKRPETRTDAIGCSAMSMPLRSCPAATLMTAASAEVAADG